MSELDFKKLAQEALEGDGGSLGYRIWSSDSPMTLDEFLAAHRPSITPPGPHGEQVWVGARFGTGRLADGDEDEGAMMRSLEQALQTWHAALDQIKRIDDDPNIPIRSSKTKGLNKKGHKQVITDKLEEDLRACGTQNDGLRGGKWLYFLDRGVVDTIFRRIVRSLQSGRLSAYAKTGSSPLTGYVKASAGAQTQGTEPKHMIAVYFENCWNKEHAVEILRCLIQDTGMVPSACKPNLYTYLRIASQNQAGIRSSVFSTKQCLTDDEITKLKEVWNEESTAAYESKAGGASGLNAKFVADEGEDEFGEPSGDQYVGTKYETGKGKPSYLNASWRPVPATDIWPDLEEDKSACASTSAAAVSVKGPAVSGPVRAQVAEAATSAPAPVPAPNIGSSTSNDVAKPVPVKSEPIAVDDLSEDSATEPEDDLPAPPPKVTVPSAATVATAQDKPDSAAAAVGDKRKEASGSEGQSAVQVTESSSSAAVAKTTEPARPKVAPFKKRRRDGADDF